MQYLHLGILQVRIQTLHWQEEEVMALIVFRDNRWLGDQAILATMEVSFLTRGYEQWRNSEANLLITRSMVGRLSNTPNIGFAYEVEGVVDFHTSHGVRALPRRTELVCQTNRGHITYATILGAGVIDSDYRVIFPVPRLLETQRGTGGFGSTSKTPVIFDKLLPREVATVLCEEEPPLDDLDGNRAGTTSPWSFILRSTNLSLDTSEPEDDYLEHIQYLAACTQPTPHSKPDAPYMGHLCKRLRLGQSLCIRRWCGETVSTNHPALRSRGLRPSFHADAPIVDHSHETAGNTATSSGMGVDVVILMMLPHLLIAPLPVSIWIFDREEATNLN
ncbi:hypothetical protein ZIOFF_073199 [Zingiber officinale]|uniref:Uncharacterized protein n=1 Tax=Zingiber officinale TaxID=94328 RepID=A0A8J5EP40_ZINOF|nr:hypothetical protein ZIOFF_073199 [Zingiber officinale]